MLSFELGYLLVQGFDLVSDKLLDFLTFFAVVHPLLCILGSDFIDELVLVLLEPFLDKHVQFLFALAELLPDVFRESMDVIVQLDLPYSNSTFLRSNSSSLTIEL